MQAHPNALVSVKSLATCSFAHATCSCSLLCALAAAAAENLLGLVDPLDAWLDPAQPLLVDFPSPDAQPPSKQLLHGRNRPSGKQQQQQSVDQQQLRDQEQLVVALGAVQLEAARFRACVLLAQQVPGLKVLRRAQGDDYVLQMLLSGRQYGAAMQLVCTLWRGAELEEKVERVVVAMVGECVSLQMEEGGGQRLGDFEGGGSAAVGGGGEGGAGVGVEDVYAGGAVGFGPGYLCSPADRSWQKLRGLLEWCDSSEPSGPGGQQQVQSGALAAGQEGSSSTSGGGSRSSLFGGRMRVSAVDALLGKVPLAQVPLWLLDAFKPKLTVGGMAGGPADPAALLRVYLKHGRLEDAAGLVLEHLAGWQQVQPLVRAGTTASTWMPLLHVEQLYGSLQVVREQVAARSKVGEGPAQIEALMEQLEGEMTRYLQLVDSDSLAVLQRGRVVAR